MMSLLLGAVLLENLGVWVTAQEILAPPSQVKFVSKDYKHVLHWTPPTNGSSLQYDVQWKIYGEAVWLDVRSCQGTQKHQCDLSHEMSDIREWYYARVCASSKPSSSKSAWTLSHRFSPRWDTQISPPSLKVNLTRQGIAVHVKPSRVLARKVTHLQHNIYVMHGNRKEEMFQITSNDWILTKMDPKTKYCLQAETTIPRHFKRSTRSSKTCIKTP